MYAQGSVRLGLVLGRHPKINLFRLHYCVTCCEVETKSSFSNFSGVVWTGLVLDIN